MEESNGRDSRSFYGVDNENDYDHHHEYDTYILEVFKFEPPIYLYLWPILVILVSSVNVVVVSVLMRGSMRSSTNMILAAIAISDSLTGLVTLPTYIAVYKLFEASGNYPEEVFTAYYSVSPFPIGSLTTQLDENMTEPNVTMDQTTDLSFDTSTSMGASIGASNGLPVTSSISYGDSTTTFDSYGAYEYSPGVSVLSKDLCTYFMISKHFLSKTFHTVSIFLTLFLGFQRLVSVAYPFRAQKYFTTKATVTVCVVIFILSPLLHVYHFFKTGKQHEEHGSCAWNLQNCKEDCAYLWIIFVIRHFLPCTLLTVFTVLFISELRNGKKGANKEQSQKRLEENRRVSMIVTAIVILFLIPEVPFGFFLLFSVIWRHIEMVPDLKTNRAIYAAYELTLLISFHFNFYIYTLLNKRFRDGLQHTFLSPVRRVFGHSRSWFPSRSSSSSKLRVTKRTKETNASGNGSQEATTRYHAMITEKSEGKNSSNESNGGIEMVVLKDSSVMAPDGTVHL